jgi:hypothetical protein
VDDHGVLDSLPVEADVSAGFCCVKPSSNDGRVGRVRGLVVGVVGGVVCRCGPRATVLECEPAVCALPPPVCGVVVPRERGGA